MYAPHNMNKRIRKKRKEKKKEHTAKQRQVSSFLYNHSGPLAKIHIIPS
jgi:hypothetical protein